MVGGRDGFSQTVATVSGQQYTLTFDSMLRPTGFDPATQQIEVVWNGTVVATLSPTADWSANTVTLTGTGSDTLTIREVESQSADGIGAMLDNFVLVASGAPAGATLALSGAPSIAEGDNSIESLTFTVTRSGNTSGAAYAFFAVSGSGANAADAADFDGTLPSGLVYFAAGETTQTLTVLVSGDTAIEADETFTVTLSSPTGATITTATATGTIQNDDAAPPSGSNLLVNGSFELPALGPGGFAAFSSVPGWTALPGGAIEVWRGAFGVTPTDGAQSLELDLLDGRDGFSQTVTTTAGQDYTLSFDTMLRPTGFDPGTQQVEVVWNGAVVATISPGAAWSTSTLTLTGTGSDTLTIREVESQSGDGIGAMLDNFVLVAAPAPPNNPPVLAAPIADQTADEDAAFNFVVPAGAFTDADGDTLTYAATLANGDPLPSWLSFNAATRTFSGTPVQANVGAVDLRVTASDGSLSADDVFTLTVSDTPDAPVISSLSVSASEGVFNDGAADFGLAFTPSGSGAHTLSADWTGDNVSDESTGLTAGATSAGLSHDFAPGTDEIVTLTVSDGLGGSASVTARVQAAPEVSATVVRVSTDTSGVQGNGSSSEPVLSADGRFVTFASSASNLVAGDTNDTADIFVKDLQTGAVNAFPQIRAAHRATITALHLRSLPTGAM